MPQFSWLVGLDTTERCVGALRWAASLKAGARAGDHAVRGVHVVEPARLAFAAEGEPDDARMIEGLRRFVQRVGVSDVLESIELVRAGSAAEGLIERAAGTGAGVIIGRVARSRGWSLTSLGSTARRVLRELPGPVCVVPPDHQPGPAGDAPVVVAIETDETCVDAARVAVRLARTLETPTVGIHAVAPIDTIKLVPESSVAYETFPTTDRDFLRIERAARDELAAWFSAHDIEPFSVRLEHGGAATVVEDLAGTERACVIVCGSRRLGIAQRIFGTSVGTDLAAHSARPVMIVPPRRHAAA